MASVICVWLCRARRAPARGTAAAQPRHYVPILSIHTTDRYPFIPPTGYAESKPLVVHDVPGSFPIAFISSSFRISRTGTPVPTMTFYSVWVLHMVNPARISNAAPGRIANAVVYIEYSRRSDVLGARDRYRRPKCTDTIETRTNRQPQAKPQASDDAGRREASGSGPKRDA